MTSTHFSREDQDQPPFTSPSASMRECLQDFYDNHATLTMALKECFEPIAALIDAIVERLKLRNGRLFYLGAGTSGRVCMLDAVDCGETFGEEGPRIAAVVAGGTPALSSTIIEIEDDSELGKLDIMHHSVTSSDCVIAVSASGTTPYAIGGLLQAHAHQALTALISCSPLKKLPLTPVHCICCDVGPEFIQGSTRLKAATAQKIILNAISTLVMTQLGKTYKGYMIELTPSNQKLRRRALEIVQTLAKCSQDQARQALEQAHFSIKLALVMTIKNLPIEEARQILSQSHGQLSTALQASARFDEIRKGSSHEINRP